VKKYTALLGAVVVYLSASSSYAAVTLEATQVAIDPTLAANGWVGYKLTLVADGTESPSLAGFDFKNPGDPADPTDPVDRPRTDLGIRGQIFQAWSTTGTIQSTGDDSRAGFTTSDSFFGTNLSNGIKYNWSNPGYTNRDIADPNSFGIFANAPSEDNSLTGSPLPNTVDWNYGVGTYMTATGAFYWNQNDSPLLSADIAFIIVPNDDPITIRGVANDRSGDFPNYVDQKWSIDYVLYQGQLYTADAFPGITVPEPASLGVLAIGCLSLLACRRRHDNFR